MQKGILRKRRPGALSEYGQQLKEKQILKGEYRLRDRQFKAYVKAALLKGSSASWRAGGAAERLCQLLEMRLDSIVFRSGLAETRAQSRQLVSHGHFLVNGSKVNIPSLRVKIGDTIALRNSSVSKILFKNMQLRLKKYQPPSWIELDKEKMEAKIVSLPAFEEINPSVDLPLIFEFYSR